MMLRPKRCPARFAFLLEAQFRRWLLRPERLVATLQLPANASVLDLGAGSGVVAKELMGKLRGGRLVLLDAQPRMLLRARRRLFSVAGVAPAFSVGVAEALPFRDGSFDLVLMVTVVGEVDDTALTMREVRRVLRPGGVVSISEQLPDLHFRSVGRVRTLLRESGFEERDFHRDRWSYMLNATRVSPIAG